MGEIAAGEGGLLLSSPHIQRLVIMHCPELSLLDNSLQGLSSLHSLEIQDFPRFPSLCIWPLLGHFCLAEFVIHNTRKFLASFEYPQTYKKEVASCKLHRLDTDDLTAFLAGLLYHHMILKSHFEKQYTPHATSAIQV